MKNKILLIITTTILVGIIILAYIQNNNQPPERPIKPETPPNNLQVFNSENVYISDYESYLNFIETHNEYRIKRQLEEQDFENKKYLFNTVSIDHCSERIINNRIEKEDNTYKIYYGLKYYCGVCPIEKETYIYEVDEELEIETFAKTISKEDCDPNVAYKPIIYIYPEEEMDLKITLGNPNNLLYTYPKYENEWNVKVSPNGNIFDYKTQRNYYGLYWEGYDNYKLNMNEGFIVKGEDSVKFLEEKLEILGLNEYEINEFVIYWIDKLEKNEYNFISFRNMEDINMPLTFSKKPDTLIRVMMDFKALDKPIEVKEQQLTKVERTGFTIVEWGGTYHK